MGGCTFCRRRVAVYARPYSGERLCAKCFVHSVEDKVRATISEYGMFQHDDRIMLAVSGGKDSLSLLYILAELGKRFSESSLCAVTVDEGIRGYRDEALKLAVKNCQKLGVDHIVTSFKVLFGVTLDEIVGIISKTRTRGTGGLTPCAYCGVLRRQALNVVAREVGADKLATAHNLDDEAQTILLNLFHGDAVRIARINPMSTERHSKLVRRAKPLCLIPEREVAFYAYVNRIRFQRAPCPYASTALRSEMRAILDRMEDRHAGTKYTLFRSVERIKPALDTAASEVRLRECRLCGEPTVGELCKPCEMLRSINVG